MWSSTISSLSPSPYRRVARCAWCGDRAVPGGKGGLNMARYLTELYLSRVASGGGSRAVAARARAAAEELMDEGIYVRYLRSIFVPEDETLFLLYDAPSAAAVEDAVKRAGLPCERVLEAESQP